MPKDLTLRAAQAKTKKQSSKSSRILAFDLLRGFFLIVIILNHLGWYPSGFELITIGGGLFVSTAEGFFLLSGIVLGIVSGQKLIDKPFKVPAKLLLKRAIQLYITSVVLMLIFTFIVWAFFMDNPGLKPGIRPIDQPLGEVLFGAFTFNYIYGWADFLRLYSIYILISPLALWLLRQGKWYLVLLASASVWWFVDINNIPLSNELMMVIPWQFIFFSGFVIGFNWEKITNLWHSIAKNWRKIIVVSLNTLAIITLLLNVILVLAAPISPQLNEIKNALSPYFDLATLPLSRLALFALWFWLGFWIFNRYEKQITKYFGWILIPFGQNSLYVYTIHAFVVFFAHLIMPNPSAYWAINLLGTLVVLGLVYAAVKTKFLMKIIPR